MHGITLAREKDLNDGKKIIQCKYHMKWMNFEEIEQSKMLGEGLWNCAVVNLS